MDYISRGKFKQQNGKECKHRESQRGTFNFNTEEKL